jgi:hypothetical protein
LNFSSLGVYDPLGHYLGTWRASGCIHAANNPTIFRCDIFTLLSSMRAFLFLHNKEVDTIIPHLFLTCLYYYGENRLSNGESEDYKGNQTLINYHANYAKALAMSQTGSTLRYRQSTVASSRPYIHTTFLIFICILLFFNGMERGWLRFQRASPCRRITSINNLYPRRNLSPHFSDSPDMVASFRYLHDRRCGSARRSHGRRH